MIVLAALAIFSTLTMNPPPARAEQPAKSAISGIVCRTEMMSWNFVESEDQFPKCAVPIESVQISIRYPDGHAVTVETDEVGYFSFEDIERPTPGTSITFMRTSYEGFRENTFGHKEGAQGNSVLLFVTLRPVICEIPVKKQ